MFSHLEPTHLVDSETVAREVKLLNIVAGVVAAQVAWGRGGHKCRQRRLVWRRRELVDERLLDAESGVACGVLICVGSGIMTTSHAHCEAFDLVGGFQMQEWQTASE
jgi:hypothetical protein